MSREKFLQSARNKGPTGFITVGESMLVVEDGQIYKDGLPIGFLLEDGYLQAKDIVLGHHNVPVLIDGISGCHFQGIDCNGLEISLPAKEPGPTGALIYNGLSYSVSNGRIITADHRYLAGINDQGEIYIRDPKGQSGKIKLTETTLLNFSFQGTKSDGENWQHQYVRPLYRQGKSYTDNEIIRYFDRFDSLLSPQKKYVLATMSLWAASGILQVVRKSEGDASLGNVKHGATGVTRIRTGNVTLDKEEFEREIEYYRQYGPTWNVPKISRDYLEVRLNLVMSHEFGHQVDFVLNQSIQEQIIELYEKKWRSCEKLHALPANFECASELLRLNQFERRHFISGYAKSDVKEYWAESFAAFSIKETRAILKELDPAICEILHKIIFEPTAVFSRVLHETIIALQASLKFGGEFSEDILSKEQF